MHYYLRIGFGAYAYPVYADRHGDGAIGFYAYFYALLVKGGEEGFVELQQGFSARADNVGIGLMGRPEAGYLLCELLCGVAAAVFAIHAPKVGIAKLADRLVPILFPTTPQVAPAKPAEYGWPTSLRTFAL